MDRPPNELDYRPAEDDRSAGRSHWAGAVGLAAAAVAWGMLALGLTSMRWRLPWHLGYDTSLWAILASFVAVGAGVVATREGRPPSDSRLGNVALLLTGSLWIALVALAAVGRR